MTSITNCRSASVNSAKVNVAIRVRPLISREITTGAKSKWKTDGQTIEQVHPGTRSALRGTPSYTFDCVFGPETRTPEVYHTVVAPIIEKSFQGYNGTILCYGQTSSGKTHTLYGNEDDPGIISLMAEDLFKRINDGQRVYYIRIGLLEIYNENMTDLLNDNTPVEDMEVGGTVVPRNLTEIEVVSPQQILQAAQRVQLERKVGETLMNQQSSRSHTILRLVVESAPRESERQTENNQNSNKDSDSHLTTAVLNFVDLAGSEKSPRTTNNEERFTESNYINKSLTSLSKVVMELSKNQAKISSTNKEKFPKDKKPYINFRDSKLTRILQSSLNGNAFVTMICNLAPASIPESHSTLRFARAAKEIPTDPKENRKLLQIGNEYEVKISQLESRLQKQSEEFEKLKGQLFVMQSFQKVCNKSIPIPVPKTNEGSVNVRRKSYPAIMKTNSNCSLNEKESNFDNSSTLPGRNRKEERSQKLCSVPCVNIPFAEWARTKKKSRRIIVESEDLKARLLLVEESEKILLEEKFELKSKLEIVEQDKELLTQRILELEEELSRKNFVPENFLDVNQGLSRAESNSDSDFASESELELGIEQLKKTLKNTKLRLALTESENERLLQESLEIQMKLKMSENSRTFDTVGTQTSCNFNYVSNWNYGENQDQDEKQFGISKKGFLSKDDENEKVKLSLRVRELEREIESMKLEQNRNKMWSLTFKANEKSMYFNETEVEVEETQSLPYNANASQKCRFPSFLVHWKSLSDE